MNLLLIVNSMLHGEFCEKDKLPTEAEFAERYSASRPTVRKEPCSAYIQMASLRRGGAQ